MSNDQPDGGGASPGGGALVPSDDRPTFTAEDLALIDFNDAAVDADVLRSARRAVELGAMTAEEAARHWNLSDKEAASLSKPAPRSKPPSSALQAINAELAEIAKLCSTDAKRYWSNAVQERQRELIQHRETADLALPDDVLAEWRQTGGVEYHLGVARKTAEAALNALGEDEQAELAHSSTTTCPCLRDR